MSYPDRELSNASHLRNLAGLLDGPLLAGMVVYPGNTVESFGDNLYGIPVHVLPG